MKQFFSLALVVIHVALMLGACGSGGGDGSMPGNVATLSWDPNSEANLAGYKLYLTTQSGRYGSSFAAVPASVTTYQVPGLQPGTVYFFAITAYDTSGRESIPSNEVSIVVQ